MKNIFKKNNIIITALAIMIVIAGYLSFTNKDTADTNDVLTVEDSDDYEEYTQIDGDNTLTDMDETDTVDTLEVENSGQKETSDLAEELELTDDMTADADPDTEDADAEDGTELADLSDEELTASTQNVADNGELDLEEGVPGEAVLANASIDASYFISSRLDREQVRAKNKALYLEIMESTEVSDEQKQAAIDAMLELADLAEKENTTEKLLEAKGFDGAVVFISEDGVEVVVNSSALTDQQLAIIEDVVKEKTGFSVENIGISPVVVAE